jgi:uncharacterized membrane protein YhaH (DUF805 family)
MDEPRAPEPAADPKSWRFLYRTDEGRIDARIWRRGATFLFVILAALTLVLVFVLPFKQHDLATTPLLSASVLGANVYVIVYVFALLLIGVCYYNLSAKRWRDIGHPPALAGLLPFCALLSGALHWLEQQGDAITPHATTFVDILLVVALIWNIIALGGLLAMARRHG